MIDRVVNAVTATVLVAALVGCSSEGTPDGGGEAPGVDLARYADANLVIISLDTLRADAVGSLGGPKGISPVLDRFAQECVVFTQARSQAPHTAPSHMSLFTSTYPSVHGVQNVAHATVNGKRRPLFQPLPPTIPLLAEICKAAGMYTVGVTEGGNLNPPHGFSRGFDVYTDDLAGVGPQVQLGIDTIDDVTALGERTLLFWHTYEIHAPYIPPKTFADNWAPGSDKYAGPLREKVESLQGKPFKQQFGKLKTFWGGRDDFSWPEAAYLHGLYKAGVRYTDSQIDALFEHMRSTGLLDSSIVVLLSDHGEEFYEHGKWQHEQVYEECLRVPLMIRLPDGLGAGRRIDTPVGLIDVMPTVLDLLGLEPDELALPGDLRMQGTSLAEAIVEGTDVEPRLIVSELRADVANSGLYEWLVALHDGESNTKYIHDVYRREKRGGDVVHFRYLFDLDEDGNERDNLHDEPEAAELQEPLVADYEAWDAETKALAALLREGAGEAGEVELTPEQIDNLILLGYLDAEDGEAMKRDLEAKRDAEASDG